jgi:hypothetical protein
MQYMAIAWADLWPGCQLKKLVINSYPLLHTCLFQEQVARQATIQYVKGLVKLDEKSFMREFVAAGNE